MAIRRSLGSSGSREWPLELHAGPGEAPLVPISESCVPRVLARRVERRCAGPALAAGIRLLQNRSGIPAMSARSASRRSAPAGPGRCALVAAWVAVLCSGVGRGQPVPLDPLEFQVNVVTTGHQTVPHVATLAGGEFVVVWTSYASAGSDSDLSSVQGQRLGPDGTRIGPQFQVNTVTTGYQWAQSVVAAPDGGFLVTWMSQYAPAGGGEDWTIFARAYAADGTPRSDQELQVNSYPTNLQAGGDSVPTMSPRPLRSSRSTPTRATTRSEPGSRRRRTVASW